jgi:Spy/CpxP family protein refolding chaperone
MRKSLRTLLVATTALLAGPVLVTSAFAGQTPPPPARSATEGVIQAAASSDHDMAAKVEQRITEMHANLKITAAQQPQWDALTMVMRENAKTMDQSFQHRVTGIAKMNAADNMQSYADMSTMHAQNMQKMVPAFKALYSVLSPEQKAAADNEFVENAHHGMDKPKG